MVAARRRSLLLLAAVASCLSTASPQSLVTQTVYGFLDFTTTMGNTVMVFSPETAPPAPPPAPPTPSAPPAEQLEPVKFVQENVIDTNPPPPSSSSTKPDNIKPSRISEKDSAHKLITSGISESSAITLASSPPKKVDKQVNAPKSVEKQQKSIITKIEVVAGPTKIVESNTPKVTPQNTNIKNNLTNKKKKESSKGVTSDSTGKIEDKPFLIPEKQIEGNTKIHTSVQNKASENKDEPAILITNNNIGEPEYDFLSRQPSEFVEETFRVVNVRPSKIHPLKQKHGHKNRPQPSPQPDDEDHPLGLVTTLRGTIVNDGATTIHETSVIGTHISGKYAQVLNSNSKILQSGHKNKISPTPTNRILKTVAPNLKNNRYNLEPSVNDADNSLTRTTRRHSSSTFKNRHKSQDTNDNDNQTTPSSNKKFKHRNSAHSQRSQSNENTSSFANRRKSSRNSGHKSTVTPSNNNDGPTRRGFKRIQTSAVEQVTPTPSTSIYKFKLNRSPGTGRWQYKTSPKPKVTIRKMSGDEETAPTTPSINPLYDETTNDISPQAKLDNDLELSGSQSDPGTLLDNDADDNSIERLPPVETLKVEISTPADFSDLYYEIATIKSPYTFQVGRIKNTRIITVTSTFEKRLEPTLTSNFQNANEPLTENILATTTPYDKDNNFLDSSIATLPPITLSSDIETPPLETVTETFSTTQNMLKTHLLPVVRDDNLTSTLTFTQTYQVTRFVTATKTMPPIEFYQFIPSKTLKEFNSHLEEAGSELHLELDFGDSNEDEDGVTRRLYLPDLDLSNIGSDFDLTEVDKNRNLDNHLRLKKAHGLNKSNPPVNETPTPSTPALTPEQAQQLALLRLLNPAAAAQIPNVITTSKPILKYETVYESHVIPVFDGKNTVQSTISRPVATITKTDYEIGTSSLPALPIQPLNPLNPLFPPQYSVTSTPVVVNTEITATDSKILKLTFGAKTVFTTLFSTKVVPTVLTSYVTTSVPVTPSAGYPGYYPPPYAPFPYVG